jgi:hypothetical protein
MTPPLGNFRNLTLLCHITKFDAKNFKPNHLAQMVKISITSYAVTGKPTIQNYTSFPIYRISDWSKTKWLLIFKIRYSSLNRSALFLKNIKKYVFGKNIWYFTMKFKLNTVQGAQYRR